MPRWTWRDSKTNGGDCVVVDIDGVISDGHHRQHFLDGPKKRWKPFFDACGDDEVIADNVERFLSDTSVTRVLLTSRPETIHDQTVTWLIANAIGWDLLIMRSNHDHGPAPTMKRAAVQQLRADGFVIALAVDDDRRNIAMYADEGIATEYVHSGYRM